MSRDRDRDRDPSARSATETASQPAGPLAGGRANPGVTMKTTILAAKSFPFDLRPFLLFA